MSRGMLIRVIAIAFFLGLNIVLGSLFLREAGLPIPLSLLPVLESLRIISPEEKTTLEKKATNPFFTASKKTKDLPKPDITAEALSEAVLKQRKQFELPILEEKEVLTQIAQDLSDKIASVSGDIDQIDTATLLKDSLDEAAYQYASLQHFSLVGPVYVNDVITALLQDYPEGEALRNPDFSEFGVGASVFEKDGSPVGVVLLILVEVAAEQPVAQQPKSYSGNDTSHLAKPLVFPPISNDDVLRAINSYRAAHAVHGLLTDNNLCEYAEKRVQDLVANGGLDNHEGFKKDFENYDNLPEPIKRYSGAGMGENLAYQYCKNMTTGESFIAQTGTALIEWCFDSSTAGHREAQLNPRFNAACVRNQNGYFVVIFGE